MLCHSHHPGTIRYVAYHSAMYGLSYINPLISFHVDDIEEELAPLMEELEPPPVETYEDQLNKARTATQGLSWVQILGEYGGLR